MPCSPYKCEAATLEGFLQQLVLYIGRAKCFLHVTGTVSPTFTLKEHDRNMCETFNLDVSRFTRSRRKADGIPPIHCLRWKSFWALLCHPSGRRKFLNSGISLDIKAKDLSEDQRWLLFFLRNSKRDRETGCIVPQYRNLSRGQPLKVFFGDPRFSKRLGYAISYSGGVTKVRIEKETYKLLKAHFVSLATKRSAKQLVEELQSLHFTRPACRWGPVQYQLHLIRKAVNAARKTAGARDGSIPHTAIPWERVPTRVFAREQAELVRPTVSVVAERDSTHDTNDEDLAHAA